jgi:hypothetical protein
MAILNFISLSLQYKHMEFHLQQKLTTKGIPKIMGNIESVFTIIT